MTQAKGVKLTTENWSNYCPRYTLNTCVLNFLIMYEYNAVNEKSQHGHALSG